MLRIGYPVIQRQPVDKFYSVYLGIDLKPQRLFSALQVSQKDARVRNALKIL